MTMLKLPPLSTFLAIVAERKSTLGVTGEAYIRPQPGAPP